MKNLLNNIFDIIQVGSMNVAKVDNIHILLQSILKKKIRLHSEPGSIKYSWGYWVIEQNGIHSTVYL